MKGNLKSIKFEHCFNLKMDVAYTLTYGHQTKKWVNIIMNDVFTVVSFILTTLHVSIK